MNAFTLAGVVASVGFASGDRMMVGHWWMSPLGAFSDVMWVTPDDLRILYAPDERVARFVTSIYRFERTEVMSFRTEGDAKHLRVEFGDESFGDESFGDENFGGRTVEVTSRFVAPIPFGRPLWFTRWVEGPIARSITGVKTYGVTRTGVRVWYQAEVYRRIRTAAASVGGESLGPWGRPKPELAVGITEPPHRASVVNLRVRLLDPSGRLDELLGSRDHPAGQEWPRG